MRCCGGLYAVEPGRRGRCSSVTFTRPHLTSGVVPVLFNYLYLTWYHLVLLEHNETNLHQPMRGMTMLVTISMPAILT